VEPEPVQNSFLLKRIKAIYAWFVILVFIIVASLLVYYKLNAAPTEPETPPLPAGTEKPLVKIGMPVEAFGIFPENYTESRSIAFNANIFEGLTIIRNGKVVTGLAVSWSNPDKYTWRFKLRGSVTFHNGNKFSAEDVKYSIEQAQANDWPLPYLSSVDKVVITDDATVELKTKEPDPVLLPKLATVFIISKQQAEKDGFKNLAGTGPYKLLKFEEKTYSLEANPNYWGGKPKIKQVIYKIISPEETAEALLSGGVDIANLTSSADNQKLSGQGFSVKSYNLPVVFFLTFDFTRDKTAYVDEPKNPFKDKGVRQALLYGINIDEFIKNAVTDGQPASQLVTSEIFGFDPKIKRPAYDLTKAKKLLTDSGYPNGFSLTVDVPASYQTDKEIVRQLERLGLKVDARILQTEEDYARTDSGDYSLMAAAWAAETLDTGEILNDLLHTKGPFNIGGYSNAELDKLTDEASVTFDSKKRLALLQKATKVAVEDLAWLPLYTTKSFAAVRSGFNWTPHNFGLIYAYEIVGQ